MLEIITDEILTSQLEVDRERRRGFGFNSDRCMKMNRKEATSMCLKKNSSLLFISVWAYFQAQFNGKRV